MNTAKDDGSLAFLGIKLDGRHKQFNCKQTSQTELMNMEFWIIDFIKDVEIKKKEKTSYLIKIKMNLEDNDSEALKFFTGSENVKMIVDKIAEMDAFPRKVTLKKAGMGFCLV